MPFDKAGRTRAVIVRKYKSDPAGHFADATTSAVFRLGKIAARTKRWDPELADLISITQVSMRKVSDKFAALSASGFRTSPGGVHVFKIGEEVTLSVEGLCKLRKDFPRLSANNEILVADSYEDGDKEIPLVAPGKRRSGDTFLGRLHRKYILDETVSSKLVSSISARLRQRSASLADQGAL